ncbi:interleukin-20 receptor subunit alpha-like [Carassius carassius]|uniref:interleukin-20 receptor subunit alpha-like n=1 Tax=Carassius carassius TaxID=217509 RepID=UPI0028684BC4|nr:interleukin-20 receptor subunit alpha-like [Carassius carassius]
MDSSLLIALCLLWTRTSGSFVEGPPEPRNVHFYSENLRNIVRWTPGEGSPNNTVYTVEYAIYGDEEESGSGQVKWRSVEHCTSITQNECDVSHETFDLEDEYYARVRAVSTDTQSAWAEITSRFSPELHTIIGAPLLELSVLQNYIDVTIKGPFRWRTKKTKKEKSLLKIFPHMIYNVSVFNGRSGHTNYRRLKNGNLTLGPLDFSTQFCVIVQAQSESRPLAYKPSKRLCVETSRDPFRDQLLASLLGGVLPSALCLCVLAVLGGLVHCYITDHRQRLPKSTHMVGLSGKHHTFQPQVPHTVIFNVMKFGDESMAVPQLMSSEDRSALDEQVQAQSTDQQPLVCYTLQHAPPPLADPPDTDSVSVHLELPDTDSVSVHSKAQHSEVVDYGIVLPAAFAAPYRTQVHSVPHVDEPHDEDQAQIFLDWSPETQELKIPLMGLLGLEDDQLQTEAVTLLPNIILRQTSGESYESEDDFTKMERDWGLVISSPD